MSTAETAISGARYLGELAAKRDMRNASFQDIADVKASAWRMWRYDERYDIEAARDMVKAYAAGYRKVRVSAAKALRAGFMPDDVGYDTDNPHGDALS